MAPVVIMLSTSLVAVPAFIRVLPVTTSGPTRTAMTTSYTISIHSSGMRAEKKARYGRRAAWRG